MLLWHFTPKMNVSSILKSGLVPNKIGIVYLTPLPIPPAGFSKDDAMLLVDTGDLRLTTFQEAEPVWEVLCWGRISSDMILEC